MSRPKITNRCSPKKITTIIRSSLFWDVTLRRVVVTDVSGQPTGPLFWTALPLKDQYVVPKHS